MDLTQVLEATASPDTQMITQAQQQLEHAAQANLPAFLTALANELSNVSKSDVARMAAGLQLKNYLTSKSIEIKVQLQQTWLSMDPGVRLHIKTAVFNTLGTEPAHHRSAAQCVAYIAAAELPVSQWPDVIQRLLANVSGVQSTEAVKEASLEAIGYICEELDPNVLAVQANEILTAIIQGMRKEEPSNQVRLAATKALLNSLEFTKANFEKENERHFIMQVVCEATQCSNDNVQVAALQNLVKIMSLYYQYMEAYMGPALFAITLGAMKSENDQISLQGIEFWSTVCDEEADLAIEAVEASELGRPPEQTSRFYVKGALPYLVPILLHTLAKQEEYDDEDDWNPCKAAGVCLSLMASCCENDIVPPVVVFVKEHLQNTDWKFRDAAVMALGSILEGPEPNTMKQFVDDHMTVLISLMSDPTVQVQDTAAWTLGRVCDQIPEAALSDQCRDSLLNGLAHGLDKEPRVAANVCWAFSSLAESAYELSVTDDEPEPATYPLSAAYEALVNKVLQTADRHDANQNNLRTSAYEALMDLIKYSAKDCYAVVQKTTVAMIDRLRSILQVDVQSQATGADKQHLADLESLICATLQSLVRKVSREDALQIAPTVMEALLLMFQSSTLGTSSSGVLEDAIMTVGVLVEVLGEDFFSYMDIFFPYLKLALQNFAAYQVCQAAVGLVGDLCRSLTAKMLPYCNDIMQIMVTNLSNAAVHRTIKPQILSTVGDVALSIGINFQTYLPVVFQILREAAQLNVTVDKNDFEMLDYVNELREGCLEAYTGIAQGLKGEGDATAENMQLVWSEVPFIFQFMDCIAQDEERSDGVVACCAGLLGDLCAAYGKLLFTELQKSPGSNIMKLMQDGKNSRTKRTKTLCSWALKEMKALQKWLVCS